MTDSQRHSHGDVGSRSPVQPPVRERSGQEERAAHRSGEGEEVDGVGIGEAAKAAQSYARRSDPPQTAHLVDATDQSPSAAYDEADRTVETDDALPSAGDAEPLETPLMEKLRELEQRVIEIQTEMIDHKERALRSVADLENLRKRFERERSDLLRFGASPVLGDLLAVFDNLHLAIGSVDERQLQGSSKGLYDGLSMVLRQLDETLSLHHVRSIHAESGEAFDPQQHQAVAQEPNQDVAAGSVVRCVARGYWLHDRLLRPARVIVASAVAHPVEGSELGADKA